MSFYDGVPSIVMGLSGLLGALMFRRSVARYRGCVSSTIRPEEAYLYFMSARLFYWNVAAAIGFFGFDLAARYAEWDLDTQDAGYRLLIWTIGLGVLLTSLPAVGRDIWTALGFSERAATDSSVPKVKYITFRVIAANAIAGLLVYFAVLALLGLYMSFFA